MRRQNLLLIAVGIPIFLIGCNSSKQAPKASNAPHGNIQLGMSLDEAKALVDSHGEKREYDALPVIPKPRDIYSKLPADTEWRVWTAEGSPTLILGIYGGKIAFKQVLWSEDGERKGDSNALPAYQ